MKFSIFLSVNIEVSIEVCSDSVHFFRKFMSSTEAEFSNNPWKSQGMMFCLKTLTKFTNTGLQEADITAMIPVEYVKYYPEAAGTLSNGEQ